MGKTLELPTFINWLLVIDKGADEPIRGDDPTPPHGAHLLPDSYSLGLDQKTPEATKHSSLADAFQRVVLEAETRQLGGWTIRTEGVDPVDVGPE